MQRACRIIPQRTSENSDAENDQKDGHRRDPKIEAREDIIGKEQAPDRNDNEPTC